MGGHKSYRHLSSISNVTVNSGGLVLLYAVVVGTGAASAVVTLREGSASGTVISVISAAAQGDYQFHGVHVPGGLYIDLAGGAADVTVVYS